MSVARSDVCLALRLLLFFLNSILRVSRSGQPNRIHKCEPRVAIPSSMRLTHRHAIIAEAFISLENAYGLVDPFCTSSSLPLFDAFLSLKSVDIPTRLLPFSIVGRCAMRKVGFSGHGACWGLIILYCSIEGKTMKKCDDCSIYQPRTSRVGGWGRGSGIVGDVPEVQHGEHRETTW